MKLSTEQRVQCNMFSQISRIKKLVDALVKIL